MATISPTPYSKLNCPTLTTSGLFIACLSQEILALPQNQQHEMGFGTGINYLTDPQEVKWCPSPWDPIWILWPSWFGCSPIMSIFDHVKEYGVGTLVSEVGIWSLTAELRTLEHPISKLIHRIWVGSTKTLSVCTFFFITQLMAVHLSWMEHTTHVHGTPTTCKLKTNAEVPNKIHIPTCLKCKKPNQKRCEKRTLANQNFAI